jgi:hypothetical protein
VELIVSHASSSRSSGFDLRLAALLLYSLAYSRSENPEVPSTRNAENTPNCILRVWQ